MPRIDRLSIFAKVGETGSISGAARALGLPKANVSRAVARLEKDYKVALVERGAKRIVLTEIGRKLHDRSERLRAEMEAIDAEIAAYRGEPSGILHVACPASIAIHLAMVLREFLDAYPAVDLRVRVSDRVLPGPGSADIVLHAGWLSDSPLVARKLGDIPTVLVAAKEYCSRHGTPATPDELEKHAVISHQYGELLLDRPETRLLPATIPPLQLVGKGGRHAVPNWRRFASDDPLLTFGLVRQGAAIAPVTLRLVKDELAAGTLVRILPDYEIADPPAIWAVRASRAATPPKVRVFLDFVAERVRDFLAGKRPAYGGTMDILDPRAPQPTAAVQPRPIPIAAGLQEPIGPG